MSLYAVAVPTFTRSLTSLKNILTKAAAHAEEKGMDPDVLVNGRLAPDMFPLKKQIQIATDSARRACGRLTDTEVPVVEDTEETLQELIARVDGAIAYVSQFTAADFEDAEAKEIELSLSTGDTTLDGTTFLMSFAFANFSFHLTTAYNILRHNGVALNKMDYLGTPQ